jgi:hypothetical protein
VLPERIDIITPVGLCVGDYLDEAMSLCHAAMDGSIDTGSSSETLHGDIMDLPIIELRTLEEVDLLRSSLEDCTATNYIVRNRPSFATVCGVLQAAHALMIDWLVKELLTHGTVQWANICSENLYYSPNRKIIAEIAPDPCIVFGAAVTQPNKKFTCIGTNLPVLWNFFVHWEQMDAAGLLTDSSSHSILDQLYPIHVGADGKMHETLQFRSLPIAKVRARKGARVNVQSSDDDDESENNDDSDDDESVFSD